MKYYQMVTVKESFTFVEQLLTKFVSVLKYV